MGRLIDADELLKRFRYGEADTDNDKAWISTIRRMIKEQPTAYDVDKVVEELGEEKTMAYDNWDGGSSYQAYSQAIDIVRKGGVTDVRG